MAGKWGLHHEAVKPYRERESKKSQLAQLQSGKLEQSQTIPSTIQHKNVQLWIFLGCSYNSNNMLSHNTYLQPSVTAYTNTIKEHDSMQ